NLKFNDLSAALACSQLAKLEAKKAMLVAQLEQYRRELAGCSHVTFPETRLGDGEIPLWGDAVGGDRAGLVRHLGEPGVFGRERWPAMQGTRPFHAGGGDRYYPVASFVSDHVLWLPNGPGVDREDISYVCERIREFYGMTGVPRVDELRPTDGGFLTKTS